MFHKKKMSKSNINSKLKKNTFHCTLCFLGGTFSFLTLTEDMKKCKCYSSIYVYLQVPGDFRGIPEVVLLSKPSDMVQKGQNALVQTEAENESEEQAELVLSDK